MQIGSNARLGDAAAGVFFNGGILKTVNTVSASRAAILGSQGGVFEVTTNTTSWSGNISGAGSLTKTGPALLILGGANTFSGNAVVEDGTLQVSSSGSLRFVVGGNGTNSALTGTGTAVIDGQFAFELAAASTVVGHSWKIVSDGLAASYGTSFLVTGFNGSGGNWTNATKGVNYVFAQSDGTLTVQSAGGNNYASWVSYWQALYPGFTNTAGAADPDGDGFVNDLEFAFDGNPAVGTPSLLTARRSGSEVKFNFVARKSPPGGVAYQLQATTNLATGPWTNSPVAVTNSLDQTGILIPTDYERREFIVPASGNRFFRVEALIAP